MELLCDAALADPIAESIVAAVARDIPVRVSAGEKGIRCEFLDCPSPRLQEVLLSAQPAANEVAQTAARLHDLKNSLAAFDAACARPTASTTDKYRARADASSHLDHARLLCHDLLVTGGVRVAVPTNPVDLGALLHGYTNDLFPRLRANIMVERSHLPACEVETSADLLRRVLDDLTKNAIEAMPGGGTLTVKIATDDGIEITVGDTGGGLPPPQLAQLRENEPVASTKRNGSGLGLASVRSALRQLGGELFARSCEKGTEMVMTLPQT